MKSAQRCHSIKQYEGHLKRLINLKRQNLHDNSISAKRMKGIASQYSSLPMRKGRLKTEGQKINETRLKKSNIKISVPIELPLVPLKQRQLLNKSLQLVKKNSREAEILLENYLLSRRIIKTKPCIKTKEFQRSFKTHQKYSKLRSKSRLIAANLSQSRLQSNPISIVEFKQFSIKGKILRHSKQSHGLGRFTFKIQIKQLQTIIRSKEEGKLYNLLLKLNGKTHKYSKLSLSQLISTHSFNFKKKHTFRSDVLYAQIQKIVNNQQYKYAQFSIDVSKAFEQIRQLSKYKDYDYHNTSEINQLKSMRSDKMVGTILYDYWIFSQSD